MDALLLTIASCENPLKKDEDVAATDGGTSVVTKDLFSTDWSVSNDAWELNYGLGNLTGNALSIRWYPELL